MATKERPNGYWNNLDTRINAVKGLIEKTGKDPKDINVKDFKKNGLGGLLISFYKDCPYLALKAAGLVDFEPWESNTRTPAGYWENAANRINAIKWLIEKIGKYPKDILTTDFDKNNLGGLLQIYRKSPYLALNEAGLADFEPWESKGGVPQGYWKESVENRVRATKWLVEKTGKDPKDITTNDFKNNGLGGLLVISYKGSSYFALKSAGYDVAAKRNKSLISAELLKKYIQN